MKAELLEGKSAYATFSGVTKSVYRGNKYYRGTEGSIEKLILKGPSAFNLHAETKLFVIRDGNDVVGRYALIKDQYLKNYIQVSFFEAQEGLGDIFKLIRNAIKSFFPETVKIVVGLNGHLNYGAGILLNRFDEVPVFGLPYNPPYYKTYFTSLQARKMITFRFDMAGYISQAKKYTVKKEMEGLKLRFMDKSHIRDESAIYTELNNKAFIHHPYWAKRDVKEDLELFYPFRFLLKNENLVIAEIDDQPVGFFFWYPDFNQLIRSQKDLGLPEVIKYKLGWHMDTFRFTEIGVIPKYQKSQLAWELTNQCLGHFEQQGYTYCEAGFIFEENRSSVNFVERMLHRAYGTEPSPYREFAVFETTMK